LFRNWLGSGPEAPEFDLRGVLSEMVSPDAVFAAHLCLKLGRGAPKRIVEADGTNGILDMRIDIVQMVTGTFLASL